MESFVLGGLNPENAGIIPRTIELVFKRKEKLSSLGWNYYVEASFLEIYNEELRDLLNGAKHQKMDIRFNEGKGTTVTNLTIKPVGSAAELTGLMAKAAKNRATAATDFNEHSSRSHAITKLYLKGTNGNVSLTSTITSLTVCM